MAVSEFTDGHGTDLVGIMLIIGSKIPEAGKERAAYNSYSSVYSASVAKSVKKFKHRHIDGKYDGRLGKVILKHIVKQRIIVTI